MSSTGGGVLYANHDPGSGKIYTLPFSKNQAGGGGQREYAHLHTYIYVYTHMQAHTYICLKYAQNKVQLPNEITEFCLHYSSAANLPPGIPSFI